MLLRPPDLPDANMMGAATDLGPVATAHPGDPLDDVFGAEESSPSPTNVFRLDRAASPAHPSDMLRLQQQHVTAGYRDGVTAAKVDSIQAGFDEGFGLGATLGLRAGELLGLLEGIAAALRGAGEDGPAQEGLAEARAELSTRSIFAAEYWASDGTWTYEVAAGEGAAGDEVVFADVANSHPLIRKWSAVVDEEIRRWSIDRTVLDAVAKEREEPDKASIPVAATMAEPVSKAPAALQW